MNGIRYCVVISETIICGASSSRRTMHALAQAQQDTNMIQICQEETKRIRMKVQKVYVSQFPEVPRDKILDQNFQVFLRIFLPKLASPHPITNPNLRFKQ